jgi:type VI secretion system ImpA family protein
MINVVELAKPLAGEKPAGENMEYDQGYLELEPLAAGRNAEEGEGPDWKLLAKNCKTLWEKTRDLRVAVYLTIAETATGGIKELAAGLQLINFLVKEMWDTMYPLLDPDDDNDPTERINIFTMLSPEAGAMNDPIMFINRLRETKIVPVLPYTIRDLLIAQGEIEPLDGKTVDLNLIMGELMGVPLPQVTEQADCAKNVKELIESTCKEAGEKMSGGNTLSLTALAKESDKLIRFFNNYFAAAGEAEEKDSAEEVPAGEVSAGETPRAAVEARATPGLAAASVNIASYKPATRADALSLLRKVIEYYQGAEPGSPIPLLLNRALRMAQMNFLELLENIAPEAAARGRDILGDAGTSESQIRGVSSRPAPSSVSASLPAPEPSSASAASGPARIPRIVRTPKTGG